MLFLAIMESNDGAARATLLGSMVSYILFVLGSYFSCDGWKQKLLAFCSMATHACVSLFLLVILPIVLSIFLGVSLRFAFGSH